MQCRPRSTLLVPERSRLKDEYPDAFTDTYGTVNGAPFVYKVSTRRVLPGPSAREARGRSGGASSTPSTDIPSPPPGPASSGLLRHTSRNAGRGSPPPWAPVLSAPSDRRRAAQEPSPTPTALPSGSGRRASSRSLAQCSRPSTPRQRDRHWVPSRLRSASP